MNKKRETHGLTKQEFAEVSQYSLNKKRETYGLTEEELLAFEGYLLRLLYSRRFSLALAYWTVEIATGERLTKEDGDKAITEYIELLLSNPKYFFHDLLKKQKVSK